MEIQVFLSSGRVHRFVEADAEAAARNLWRMAPTTMFTGSMITIGSKDSSVGFPSGAVMRVECKTDAKPDWHFAPNLTDVRVLDAAGFEAGVARVQKARAEATRAPATGDEFVGHVALEQITGETLYLEARGKLLPGAVRMHAMQRVLESPCVVAQRADDTWVLINPHNLVAMRLIPGNSELPSTAWSGEPAGE